MCPFFIGVKMKKFGLVVIFCVLFTGCATLKMTERWPRKEMSAWVKGAPPTGCFRGMAINAPNEREGWQIALDDVKKQICSSIGFETREECEKRVMAYSDQVDKKIVADFKCTSAALLEDIESGIKDTYFEKWMERTDYGKKYFCNCYILVYCPREKIDEMKRKTAQENEERLSSLKKCISVGEMEEMEGDFIKALRSYIYGLKIADTLFNGRETNILGCTYRIAALVSSLHLVKLSNYSEKPGSKHRVSVRASIGNIPAANVPVRFEISSGEGRVEPLVFTDGSGIASSGVKMNSICEDNQIRAFIDLTDILSADGRLAFLNEIKEVEFTFSTLSKVANVQGGTLYVDREKESWFKKILVLRYDLREINDLGAEFDRYDIEVRGLFEHKHWLTGRMESWSRSEVGSFNLNERIVIEAKDKKTVVSKWNAWLMDTFRNVSKEKHCRKIQLILTLYGKDYNGNICKVIMESTPMPANP
jgi:hypothetical protein